MNTDISARDQLLDEVVTAYLRAVAAGQAPDRETLLVRHPDLAADLVEFFADQDRLQHVAAPLRKVARAAAGEEELVAHTLGDFRILREVGRGGMGVVFEAEQISLGRRVALKVLPFAATMDPRQLLRFQNEAKAAASLEHPHIVPVYGVGSERGVHYYAMKFIDGQSLDTLLHNLRRPADLTTDEPGMEGAVAVTVAGTAEPTERAPRDTATFRRVAEWGVQAAEALEHAHVLGIVHRDVKPGNLMVDGQGKVWVTDFGLARLGADAGLTLTGDLMGTLRYMSPEQALAKHGLVDHRTDVYGLGVTLYELLTLEPAVTGQDREEVLHRIAAEEPRPPRRLDRAIPAELETVVLKAMAKDPAERYATAGALADDLRRFLADEPIRARRPTLAQRLRKLGRRHRAVGTTATVAAAALLVLGVVGLTVDDA